MKILTLKVILYSIGKSGSFLLFVVITLEGSFCLFIWFAVVYKLLSECNLWEKNINDELAAKIEWSKRGFTV